jgi:hypothetical protein
MRKHNVMLPPKCRPSNNPIFVIVSPRSYVESNAANVKHPIWNRNVFLNRNRVCREMVKGAVGIGVRNGTKCASATKERAPETINVDRPPSLSRTPDSASLYIFNE